MDGGRGGYHCTNIVETVCYIILCVCFEGVGVIMQSGISCGWGNTCIVHVTMT